MSTQELFANNYEPYALNQVLRNSEEDKDLKEAAYLYRNKDYEKSLPSLQNALKSNNSPALKIALSISHFENGEPIKALENLNEIIILKDPFLSDVAHWYSALFYLHAGQVEKAKVHLEFLADSPERDKHNEAKKILEKLV